jgi:hypothetical protein
MFRCKPLISNEGILTQLEKFYRKINDRIVSLNQRVPGSSPGAPTKQYQLLKAIADRNGPFLVGKSCYDCLRLRRLIYDLVAISWTLRGAVTIGCR